MVKMLLRENIMTSMKKECRFYTLEQDKAFIAEEVFRLLKSKEAGQVLLLMWVAWLPCSHFGSANAASISQVHVFTTGLFLIVEN
jgi:hypothetical protein